MTSSKASKYGHGDMYKGAISRFVMKNLETSSAVSMALERAVTPIKLCGSAIELGDLGTLLDFGELFVVGGHYRVKMNLCRSGSNGSWHHRFPKW